MEGFSDPGSAGALIVIFQAIACNRSGPSVAASSGRKTFTATMRLRLMS